MENMKEDMGLAGLRDNDIHRQMYWQSKIQSWKGKKKMMKSY